LERGLIARKGELKGGVGMEVPGKLTNGGAFPRIPINLLGFIKIRPQFWRGLESLLLRGVESHS